MRTRSLPYALYDELHPGKILVIEIPVFSDMQRGFDIESEKLDKRDDFDKESPPSRLFGLSLSESALLTQLLIFCLRRREVLMSYFIACFEEVSPRLQSRL